MTATALPGTDFDAVLGSVEEELARWQVPGVEVAAVRDGAVAFTGGVGVRGIDDPEPVTATTFFHHGSCGKAFTAVLATIQIP